MGYYSVDLPAGSYTIDINYVDYDWSNTLPRKLKIESGVYVDIDVDFNTDTGMYVIPSAGNYIPNSEIWLQYVHIEKVFSDKQYFAPWYPLHTVNEGEFIIEVSGSIQNKHPQYEYITMYAEGYDETGEQVAWTLDDAHIAGQIGLYLKNEETSEFTLHLNFSDNMKTIHIFANVYGLPPP